MTSKLNEHTLCSILFKTLTNYDTNLQTLLSLIKQTKKNSFIVAPEVCLSGFDYENIDEVVAFSKIAVKEIKKASHQKIIILTMLDKKDEKIYNFARVFHNGEMVYERAKSKLFRMGNEHKYMQEGSDDDFKIIEVAGIKMAIFICFELRFKELWEKAQGADVVAIPSWWGRARGAHFKSFIQTLAIMNQCYVVASDSLNEECTNMSAIITPNGEVRFNDDKSHLELKYNKKDITLMRKYIDVGIK